MHSSSRINKQWSTGISGHNWVGETDVIKTATIGGQQMTAMQWSEDGSEYALIYLGQTSTGFGSLSAAQGVASSFAISVLAKMSASISAVA
ncbi:hypothetical protein BLL42_27540 (plasmid) [Pseudomonas frederiksbergensis]|uniref:Uncharacterized protein n=1 Tax=Pseudomonas frederiksbergensis TaxID=104087 RepID=A0A1J0ETL3_9PSED|nr:hypothetical protein [Pseudomonas frederiksbergensis]APC19490.1 hypothetical protein BLL42_27540 [Pseudomonas frederiksbergensis]